MTSYGYTESYLDPGVTTPANQSGTNDAKGNVTRIVDANGNTVERWYDLANRLVTERTYGSNTSSANIGQYAHYVYDGEGHLRFSISAEGLVTEYGYQATGELLYTRSYPGNSYTAGALTAPSEAAMNTWLAGITDKSTSQLMTYAYDVRGNMLTSVNYGSADAAGNGTAAEGYSRTDYVYDANGRLLSRTGLGQVSETFVYDGMDRVIASTDLNGGTTSVVFNDAATQTVVTLANGQVTTSTYNKAGDLVS
ncbi:hypothetical protein ACFOWX_13315, partial [Sphingorhabdus arenilitoris]